MNSTNLDERTKAIHAHVRKLLADRSDVLRGWKNYRLLPNFDLNNEPKHNRMLYATALEYSRGIVLAWACLPSNDQYDEETVLHRLRVQLSLPIDGEASWNAFGASDTLLHEASWDVTLDDLENARITWNVYVDKVKAA